MKKALFYSGVMIFMMVVFMLGVSSGLKGEALSFSVPSSESASAVIPAFNNIPSVEKNLDRKHTSFSGISGEESTINGIPVKIWLGKSIDSAKQIANSYCDLWTREGFYASQSGKKDALFANAVDPGKKMFYGAMTYKNSNTSTIVPFSIDMKDPEPKDTFDSDFPFSLRKKKGVHFRTKDGKMSYETLFYIDKHPVSETCGIIESAFINQGWKKENDLRARNYVQEIRTFVKQEKTCIISVAPAPKNDRRETLVVIQMGNV